MSPSQPPGRGVLDTNTVILLPRLGDARQLPGEAAISAVTLAEMSAGPLVARTDPDRTARQAQVQQAEADFDAIPFDAPAARAFGQVVADLRTAGRKPSARAYDALIAATAIANDLPLYTVNPADYTGITSLRFVPTPHPDPGLLSR